MSRQQLPSIVLATLVIAGCGGGGLNFWLYPEPRLPEPEEATFVAYESHQLQAIDGEDTALKCWGGPTRPQAYTRTDRLCRLHILPGQHSVVFYPGRGSRDRVSLTFTALPGKAYGLNRSECAATAGGLQEICRVEVVEIEEMSVGG